MCRGHEELRSTTEVRPTETAVTGPIGDNPAREAAALALMRRVGLSAYHAEVAWDEVMPDARVPRRAALDAWSRFVDRLLAAEIVPVLTLGTYALPRMRNADGGWAAHDTAAYYGEFVHVMLRTLGDRVRWWIGLDDVRSHLLNAVVAPPSDSVPPVSPGNVFHGLLAGYHRGRAAFDADGQGRFGVSVQLAPVYPATDAAADSDVVARAHALVNGAVLDSLFLGAVPDVLSSELSAVGSDEPAGVHTCPPGFIDVRYQTRLAVAGARSAPFRIEGLVRPLSGVSPGPTTQRGWEVYPEGLLEVLAWVHATYDDVPLFATLQGGWFLDAGDGRASPNDQDRVAYLREHLHAVVEARDRGLPVDGFFYTPYLDAPGPVDQRDVSAGLVRIDLDTMNHIPKASARFYHEIIASRGATLRR